MTTLPSLLQARADRDEAIEEVLASTEQAINGWGDLALVFLRRYAATHAEFSAEDVTDAASVWGLAEPKDLRAWGAVFKRARRANLIERSNNTYARRRGHATLSFLWRSRVCS